MSNRKRFIIIKKEQRKQGQGAGGAQKTETPKGSWLL